MNFFTISEIDMNDIKGLIFDCDGTLADTMPLHWHAWQIITQRHKLHFPEDRFYALAGVPSQDILKMLANEQGSSIDHIAVTLEKESVYIPLITQADGVSLHIDWLMHDLVAGEPETLHLFGEQRLTLRCLVKGITSTAGTVFNSRKRKLRFYGSCERNPLPPTSSNE